MSPTVKSKSLRQTPHDQVVHHQSPRKRREQKPGRMQLNLTSMIDVTFQLLIYFVVTASFAIDEGIITARMASGTGEAPKDVVPEKPLTIVIESVPRVGYRLVLEGQREAPTNFRQLYRVLDDLRDDRAAGGKQGVFAPTNPIVIKPMGDVRWQHVVNAFNATLRAKYSNVSFAQAEYR
jgi:biopolymer transport protein ExbD